MTWDSKGSEADRTSRLNEPTNSARNHENAYEVYRDIYRTSCRQSFCKHASLRTVQISRTCAQERCVPIPFARCPKYESHDKFARLLFDVHFAVAYRSRYIFNFLHHDTFHLSSHLSFLSFISLYVSLFIYISSCMVYSGSFGEMN